MPNRVLRVMVSFILNTFVRNLLRTHGILAGLEHFPQMEIRTCCETFPEQQFTKVLPTCLKIGSQMGPD